MKFETNFGKQINTRTKSCVKPGMLRKISGRVIYFELYDHCL